MKKFISEEALKKDKAPSGTDLKQMTSQLSQVLANMKDREPNEEAKGILLKIYNLFLQEVSNMEEMTVESFSKMLVPKERIILKLFLKQSFVKLFCFVVNKWAIARLEKHKSKNSNSPDICMRIDMKKKLIKRGALRMKDLKRLIEGKDENLLHSVVQSEIKRILDELDMAEKQIQIERVQQTPVFVDSPKIKPQDWADVTKLNKSMVLNPVAATTRSNVNSISIPRDVALRPQKNVEQSSSGIIEKNGRTYYSFERTQSELGITADKIKELVSEQEMRAFRDGDTMMFLVSDVEAEKKTSSGIIEKNGRTYYSFERTQSELGITADKIKELVSEQEMRAFRDGDTMMFLVSDVEERKRCL